MVSKVASSGLSQAVLPVKAGEMQGVSCDWQEQMDGTPLIVLQHPTHLHPSIERDLICKALQLPCAAQLRVHKSGPPT